MHKQMRRPATIPAARIPYLPNTSATAGTVKVDITTAHVLTRFSPKAALGAGVDAIGAGSATTLFTTANVNKMLSSGEGGLSYRLYTELNIEDWHWNPLGTWSDSKNSQGYFTGSNALGSSIVHSYGYYLTHRGSTYDFGDNLVYSAIDDNNPNTYWKSNPYLTSTYTHEADSLHPQWILFIFNSPMNINAAKIQWANPYAVSYQVQYWTGDDPLYDAGNGSWVTFPGASVTNATGGTTTLKFTNGGTPTQFVRILMTQSSGTYDTHGTSDARNKMGYAVYEAGIGNIGTNGVFTDYVTHSPDQNQTTIYVSSTDPWHSATAINSNTEQVGLDFILQNNVTQHLAAMVAVPMLFSTPENAAAEASYLIKRRYPLVGIELGEEPDGQFCTPEDYAALYIQWATAIRKVAPTVRLGGPITSANGVQSWPDAKGNTDFLHRFVTYLIAHGALSDLGFVSTEHYPFYLANLDWTMVPQEVSEVQQLFSWVSAAQVPKAIPIYVTEYNLDAAADEPTVDLLGALWHSVFVGEFMKHGGAGAFYYQDLPYQVSNGGTSYGLIGMFASDDNDKIIASTSQYFSTQLMTQEWCLPGTLSHAMLPSSTTITDSLGSQVVLSYALLRPDGQYSLLLVNTDQAVHTVSATFSNTKVHYFTGNVTQLQFSAKDYAWISNGLNGTASPDGPYEKTTVASGSKAVYTLPGHSITVLRGKVL